MVNLKIDPSWIVFAVIVILVIVFWKPIIGVFHKEVGVMTGQKEVDKGKQLFYDIDAWGVHNASCAMCHTKDYASDKNAPIPFKVYYVPMKDVASQMGATWTGTDDRLIEQINKCLSAETRINMAGGLPPQSDKMKLLIAYVKSL
jgi:cytochrome c553